MKKYIDFALEVYGHNKAVGWWDEPRSVAKLTNLIISENSEALEGDRKNLMDDKLTHHIGSHVELADTLIRTLDMIAHYGETHLAHDVTESEFLMPEFTDFNQGLAYCTSMVSAVFLCSEFEEDDTQMCRILWGVVMCLEKMSVMMGFDLLAMAKEKQEFNKNRKDHTREHREGENGKKY
ncbi:pyrophosphatase [Vibrio phage D63]